jgi:hypothetical protein
MPAKKKGIRYRGYSIKPVKPRGMKRYSVAIAGGRAKQTLNCQTLLEHEAIECGKVYVDNWIELKKGSRR